MALSFFPPSRHFLAATFATSSAEGPLFRKSAMFIFLAESSRFTFFRLKFRNRRLFQGCHGSTTLGLFCCPWDVRRSVLLFHGFNGYRLGWKSRVRLGRGTVLEFYRLCAASGLFGNFVFNFFCLGISKMGRHCGSPPRRVETILRLYIEIISIYFYYPVENF